MPLRSTDCVVGIIAACTAKSSGSRFAASRGGFRVWGLGVRV